jgi:hypothetical protein
MTEPTTWCPGCDAQGNGGDLEPGVGRAEYCAPHAEEFAWMDGPAGPPPNFSYWCPGNSGTCSGWLTSGHHTAAAATADYEQHVRQAHP